MRFSESRVMSYHNLARFSEQWKNIDVLRPYFLESGQIIVGLLRFTLLGFQRHFLDLILARVFQSLARFGFFNIFQNVVFLGRI